MTQQQKRKNWSGTMNKKIILLSVIFVFSLLIASTVSIQVLQQRGEDARRLTNNLGFSGYSSIATEPDGEKNVVWHDNRTGTYQIFYNKMIPPDYPLIWPIDLQLTNSPGDAMYPAIAIDTHGYIHVVWQDNRDGNWEIYYKKLDNNGITLTGDERVTNDPAYSLHPTLTVDSNDNVHISWYDNRSGNYEIYYEKRVEPDVTPSDLTFTPTEPLDGQTISLNVTTENLGDNAAADVKVFCYIDNTYYSNVTISLAAYASQTVSFSWTGVFGTHQILVRVDPENLISEKNEENNVIGGILTVYRITEFHNNSIWANTTVKHAVPLTVTIQRAPDPMAGGTPNNIGQFVNYTANNSIASAVLKIGYTHDQLGTIQEASLKMYYWDVYYVNGSRWNLIEDSGVNVNDNYVWANVTHFTIFAPLGSPLVNNPPYTPSNPSPGNGSTNVPITGNLSWTGGDPDPDDTATYDVYFDTTTPPPIKVHNQSATTYNPGMMNYSTTYYWKIKAWDNHGASTTGPIWSFTTQPVQSPTTPIHVSDGCHTHDHPNDMNKGIGKLPCYVQPPHGVTQTFSTTSTNTGSIYYKFYFGDGQDSGWLGPYTTGQVATATHDYNAIGVFQVTAKAKIGTTESIPSPALSVRMYKCGDINGDNLVDFGDINPFVLQLTSGKNAYYTVYPNAYWWTGDINNDCDINFGDINPFVQELTSCPP